MSHVISKSNVLNATDDTLAEFIGQSPLPTLVDFWAPWCAPCRLLAPIVGRVADAYQGRVQVLSVNVDENPRMSAAYDIRSIPTLILFHGGEAVARTVGAVPIDQLEQLLDAALERAQTSG